MNNPSVFVTIEEMQSYKGSNLIAFVMDFLRGGIFIKSKTGKEDFGVTFAAAGGGFWERKYDGYNVPVSWFGATGLYEQDCTDIFEKFFAYLQDGFVFQGGVPIGAQISRKGIIGNGHFRWRRPLKIGGAPITCEQSLIEQYSDSPNRDLTEHLKIGATRPFSIEGSDYTFLHGDFECKELTAILTIGFSGHQAGFYSINNAKVSNLTFVGNIGMENVEIAKNKQQGLQVFAAWGVRFENLNYINLEVSEQYNMSYFSYRHGGKYQNCGLGLINTGSHSQNGGNLVADHCGLGFHIKGGASAWTQMNTEQSLRSIIVDAPNVLINGFYFEQLDKTTPDEDYQIEVNSVGVTFDTGVTNYATGKSIKLGANADYISFKNANNGEIYSENINAKIVLENTNIEKI